MAGCGSLVLPFSCFGVGLILGALYGSLNTYHLRYLEERAIIAPILAKDPAFAAVEIHERSDGGVWLLGEVPAPEDRERLRTSVTRALGESRSKEVMAGVEVKP